MKRTLSILALACALAPLPSLAGSDPHRELLNAMNAKDKAGVVKALQALGEEGGAKTVDTVINVALNLDGLTKFSAEASNEIFDAAEAALAGVKDPKGEAALFDHLEKKKGEKDWKLRVFLCDVIARKKTEAAEDALVKAVKDGNPTVSKTAISHLGIRKSKKAFDNVIEVLAKVEKKQVEPWVDCEHFLAMLSGKDLKTAQEWKDWWAASKEKFDPNAVAAARRSGTGVGETIARNAPKLFGTEILSKKVVFILDVSGSMKIRDPKQEPGQPKKESCSEKDPGYADIPAERERLHRLREAMAKLVTDLPADTRFTIFTFATSVRAYSTELVDASAGNKEKAVEFARGMQAEGFTVTDQALREAFAVADANTFYLFSDGVPQRGKNADGTPQMIDKREILEEVEQMNRVRKVKIFTIGIGEADPIFMARLAEMNGGTFTAVD